MRNEFRRIGKDIRERRHLDAYAVTVLAVVFAVLSVVGDSVPDGLRWGALLAGVGLLVYRVTMPEGVSGQADDILNDRSSFEDRPLPTRLRNAREVWVFAPSGVNLLSPQNCETLRSTVLNDPNGVVRVVLLDPAEEQAVELAVRQLDDSHGRQLKMFRSSLEATVQQLRRMSRLQLRGDFEYRLLDQNPGFSLVAIDPSTRNGVVIVEFHGFHNELTNSRMHIEITRTDAERWYAYWLEQFDHLWQAARAPAD